MIPLGVLDDVAGGKHVVLEMARDLDLRPVEHRKGFQFSFRYPNIVVGSWIPTVSTPSAFFTGSSTSASIW